MTFDINSSGHEVMKADGPQTEDEHLINEFLQYKKFVEGAKLFVQPVPLETVRNEGPESACFVLFGEVEDRFQVIVYSNPKVEQQLHISICSSQGIKKLSPSTISAILHHHNGALLNSLQLRVSEGIRKITASDTLNEIRLENLLREITATGRIKSV